MLFRSVAGKFAITDDSAVDTGNPANAGDTEYSNDDAFAACTATVTGPPDDGTEARDTDTSENSGGTPFANTSTVRPVGTDDEPPGPFTVRLNVYVTEVDVDRFSGSAAVAGADPVVLGTVLGNPANAGDTENTYDDAPDAAALSVTVPPDELTVSGDTVNVDTDGGNGACVRSRVIEDDVPPGPFATTVNLYVRVAPVEFAGTTAVAEPVPELLDTVFGKPVNAGDTENTYDDAFDAAAVNDTDTPPAGNTSGITPNPDNTGFGGTSHTWPRRNA